MQCKKSKKCKVFADRRNMLLKSLNVKCFNCGGGHIPEFPECPVRVKEVEGSRIRAVQQIANVETVKRVEGEKGHRFEENRNQLQIL
jgi:hypothetical protein